MVKLTTLGLTGRVLVSSKAPYAFPPELVANGIASDVFFGGGAEQFKPGSGSPNRTNYYNAFAAQGYQVVNNNTALQAADPSKRTLGIFSQSNMAK